MRKNSTPDDKFTSAHEAIGNLLMPELEATLSSGWTAALSANSEIKTRPISQRPGPFHSHLLPLLKHLASLLASGYKRYFKLALAHPQQSGPDPHGWSLLQLETAVGLTLAWIRNWYVLACDGVEPIASIPFQPGKRFRYPFRSTGRKARRRRLGALQRGFSRSGRWWASDR